MNVLEEGPLSINASYLHILFLSTGPGHVLYLKSELTNNRWCIHADNIAMTRWLQETVQGILNEETAVTAIFATEAAFSKYEDYRDFLDEAD